MPHYWNRIEKHGPGKRHGFSLIELLAAIVVITILSLLAYVGIRSAINSANKSSTVSNLRQIGSAALLYSADHQGKIFPYRSTEWTGYAANFFQYLPAYYMDGNYEAFIAPGDDLQLFLTPTKQRGPYVDPLTGDKTIYYSFARNLELPKPATLTFLDNGTASNMSMPAPSQTALLFLTRQNGAMYRNYPLEYHGLSNGEVPTETLVCFLDGHVQPFEIVALKEDTAEMRTLWYGYPEATKRQDF